MVDERAWTQTIPRADVAGRPLAPNDAKVTFALASEATFTLSLARRAPAANGRSRGPARLAESTRRRCCRRGCRLGRSIPPCQRELRRRTETGGALRSQRLRCRAQTCRTTSEPGRRSREPLAVMERLRGWSPWPWRCSAVGDAPAASTSLVAPSRSSVPRGEPVPGAEVVGGRGKCASNTVCPGAVEILGEVRLLPVTDELGGRMSRRVEGTDQTGIALASTATMAATASERWPSAIVTVNVPSWTTRFLCWNTQLESAGGFALYAAHVLRDDQSCRRCRGDRV